MATLTTTHAAAFTPAKGRFTVHCSGAPANIQSRQNSSAAWVWAGEVAANTRVDVDNEVAGTEYRVIGAGPVVPTISADQ